MVFCCFLFSALGVSGFRDGLYGFLGNLRVKGWALRVLGGFRA